MNPAKKTVVVAKNFVVKHKVPVVIIATAAVTTVVVKKVCAGDVESLTEFLADKGLLEEFKNRFEENVTL